MSRAALASRTPIALALPRAEAAAACGISPGYFDRLVQHGTLPPGRVLGGKAVWLVDELRAALADLPADGERPLDARHEVAPI